VNPCATAGAVRRDPLVIVAGLSARAAVESAEWGGFRVRAVDWFQDRDTREAVWRSCVREGVLPEREFVPPCESWDRIAEAVSTMVATSPEGVIVPTGGVENHLDVLAAWSQTGRCAAGPVEAIRRVRDPEWLAECLAGGELAWPRTCGSRQDGRQYTVGDSPASGDPMSEWLWKPLASGGGIGVRPVGAGETDAAPTLGAVRQRFVPGQACSVAFLAKETAIEWLGMSRQCCGIEQGAASPFGYVGNIEWRNAPIAVCEAVRDGAERIAREAGLTGLFGLDLVVDASHRPWLIEVNPRWTASLELYERRLGRSLLRDHLTAWGYVTNDTVLAPLPAIHAVPPDCLGKWTVYANRPCVATDPNDDVRLTAEIDGGLLADIPHPGTAFRAGDPVCTVLAGAVDERACRAELLRRAEQVRSRLLR
jgi:uncharacterized protein